MTSFEEKPILFLDYPLSLIHANPALGKDGREEAMGTGEESSKPVYSLARPIC